MRAIRLSGKSAKRIEAHLFHCIPEDPAYLELAAALKPKPKKPSAKAREGKRVSKRDETAAIRAAALARAGGRCECGCGRVFQSFHPAQMDHFWGRGRAESLESCWMLTAQCHTFKTRNSPDAAHWLAKFLVHCQRHGYGAEVDRACAALAKIRDEATLDANRPSVVQARAEMGRGR